MNPTAEIVVLDSTEHDLNSFFEAEPNQTHWGEIIPTIPDLKPEDVIAEIQKMEPLLPGSEHHHAVWVKQQILRQVIRYKKGLPNTGPVCGVCGDMLSDPVLKICLWCAEWDRQMPDSGGRGSCWFLKPKYDPANKTWGLLYHQGHGDDKFLMWVARGYETVKDAWLAMYPIAQYERWLKRKYNGVGNFWYTASSVLNFDWLMEHRKELPFSTVEFKGHLRDRIRVDMGENKDQVDYAIWNAMVWRREEEDENS